MFWTSRVPPGKVRRVASSRVRVRLRDRMPRTNRRKSQSKCPRTDRNVARSSREPRRSSI